MRGDTIAITFIVRCGGAASGDGAGESRAAIAASAGAPTEPQRERAECGVGKSEHTGERWESERVWGRRRVTLGYRTGPGK